MDLARTAAPPGPRSQQARLICLPELVTFAECQTAACASSVPRGEATDRSHRVKGAQVVAGSGWAVMRMELCGGSLGVAGLWKGAAVRTFADVLRE